MGSNLVSPGKTRELLCSGRPQARVRAPGAIVMCSSFEQERESGLGAHDSPSGPFSARDRAGALASNGDAASGSAANRFPSGINVAAAYGLSRASASYKTGGPRPGEVSDVSSVRPFADALDQIVPTTQALWNRTAHDYVYLHSRLDKGVVRVRQRTGVLTSLAERFAGTPGPAYSADRRAEVSAVVTGPAPERGGTRRAQAPCTDCAPVASETCGGRAESTGFDSRRRLSSTMPVMPFITLHTRVPRSRA